MKKRKEEILHNKKQSTEQSTVQSTVQPSVQSSVQSTVQPTEQPSVQSTVQSNGAYVYDAGILAVVAIGVCVFFFLHITLFSLKINNSSMKNDFMSLRGLCNK